MDIKKKTTFRAAAVAALVTPALLLGPAASAEVVGSDAPPPIGESKAINVTHVKFNNAKKAMVYTIKFRSLKIKKAAEITGFARPVGKKFSYRAGVARLKKGGKLRPVFGTKKKGQAATRKKCKGLKFKRPAKNRVVIKVPQKCYGKNAGTMHLGVFAIPNKGKKDALRWPVSVKRG